MVPNVAIWLFSSQFLSFPYQYQVQERKRKMKETEYEIATFGTMFGTMLLPLPIKTLFVFVEVLKRKKLGIINLKSSSFNIQKKTMVPGPGPESESWYY